MTTIITYQRNNEELKTIRKDGIYYFGDWLKENGISFEKENNVFYVVEDGKRTGEKYGIYDKTYLTTVCDPYGEL